MEIDDLEQIGDYYVEYDWDLDLLRFYHRGECGWNESFSFRKSHLKSLISIFEEKYG